MSANIKKILAVTLVLAVFGSVDFLKASADTAGEASPKVVVSVTPQNPRPGDVVNISLSSGFTDLNLAEIAWAENGNITASGMGKIKYSITAGKIGSVVNVTATVKTAEGNIWEYPIVIRPSTVDIIWESDSTVPPFYKGKALYTHLGHLRLVAIPTILTDSGKQVDPSTLIYTWKRQDQVLGERSGLGNQSITMNEPVYRVPFTVGVTAAAPDGSYVAEGNIEIDTANPFVEIYVDNPVYGILFNRPVGSQITFPKGQVTFEAFPYYFSASGRYDQNLKYVWSLNYVQANSSSTPSISLGNDSDERGSANLTLSVNNDANPFEMAGASLNLNFGQQ